jgi:hypothetical protein
MNRQVTSRISAALVLGLALSFAIHQMKLRNSEMGKANYEASQAQRFEHYYVNPSEPVAPAPLFASLMVAGSFIGAYELLAFGIYAIIKSKPGADGA